MLPLPVMSVTAPRWIALSVASGAAAFSVMSPPAWMPAKAKLPSSVVVVVRSGNRRKSRSTGGIVPGSGRKVFDTEIVGLPASCVRWKFTAPVFTGGSGVVSFTVVWNSTSTLPLALNAPSANAALASFASRSRPVRLSRMSPPPAAADMSVGRSALRTRSTCSRCAALPIAVPACSAAALVRSVPLASALFSVLASTIAPPLVMRVLPIGLSIRPAMPTLPTLSTVIAVAEISCAMSKPTLTCFASSVTSACASGTATVTLPMISDLVDWFDSVIASNESRTRTWPVVPLMVLAGAALPSASAGVLVRIVAEPALPAAEIGASVIELASLPATDTPCAVTTLPAESITSTGARRSRIRSPL